MCECQHLGMLCSTASDQLKAKEKTTEFILLKLHFKLWKQEQNTGMEISLLDKRLLQSYMLKSE